MRLSFLFLLFFGFTTSCNSGSGSISDTPKLTGIKDFDLFYQRFHRDTAYQTLHITFPLEGLPPNAKSLGDEMTQDFRWQKSDWEYHQLINDKNFSTQFQIFDESLITEYIKHKSGKMGLMRRFSKIQDEWFLIYYVAMNPLGEKKNENE